MAYSVAARDAQAVTHADTHPLARRIGHLIQMEREKQELTQAGLARRAGIDQPALSRVECGRRGTSTTLVDRVLAALGYRLTIGVEPLDRALDEAIAKYAQMSDEDRSTVAGRFRYPMRKLATVELDYRMAGTFGAFLQGVPVDAVSLDLAIAPDGADAFATWLGRMPNVLPLPLIAMHDPLVARIVDRIAQVAGG